VFRCAIVEAFDEGEQGHARLRLGLEPAAVQEFAFERGEKALRHGVVVGVANRAHGGANARLAAAVAESDGRVLRALIRMVDHASRLADRERHVQRRKHNVGVQRQRHRPANDPPAEHVENDGEVEKAGPGWNKSDIGDPKPVGRFGLEGALDQIGRLAATIAHRRFDKTAAADAGQTGGFHQPRDALAADGQAAFDKFGVDARAAIGPVRGRVDGADALD